MRLLCLPSEGRGEEWFKLSQKIDETIETENLDLAEEAVYLSYNRGPGAVLHQEANCLVGRSIIGPRKEFAHPLTIVDWKSATVFWVQLKANEWQGIWEEALTVWEELQKANKKLSSSFFIKLSRRLEPRLTLTAEVVFHE
jgi:hypothetical protein